MDIVFLIGRIIFGGYFVFMGLNHLFMGREMLTGYAQHKGVPAPSLAVVGTGLLLLAGGVSVLTGLFVFWGAIALIVFLLGVNFGIHNFWTLEGEAQAAEMSHFMKNFALIGASLIILYLSNGSWPFSF